jgi:hypothetical protein
LTANLAAADAKQQEMTALGLLGLIPFFACAAVVVLSPPQLPATAVSFAPAAALIYGAVIAAYLAGVRAGAVLSASQSTRGRFVLGQALLLIAFFAALAPAPSGDDATPMRHVVIAGVLLALWAQDKHFVSSGAVPSWYGRLRTMLTAGAVSALLLISATLFLRGAS